MAALKRRGLRVAPFKVGPDFIDPGHHTRITGVISRNLDGWMLPEDRNRTCFYTHTEDTDIALVEGVMGLFDGYDGRSEAGSTAQMAKWLGLPVLLAVDAGSMARSAAALVQGFERFDAGLRFAGVVFNRLGSERHLQYLKDALADHVEMDCLGGILRNETIAIPERHLGLVTQEEYGLTPERIGQLADLVENAIDLDALLAALPALSTPDIPAEEEVSGPPETVRIGVARDASFCFYYEDNLDLLRKAGATLVPFSPVHDDRLPERLDGLYFGGGYPELFAAELSSRTTLRREIRKKSRDGMPIYGECGGFMYLSEQLQDADGNTCPMTGCFPFTTTMSSRLRSLGYREVTLRQETPIGRAGETIRGHEFHYSGLTGPAAEKGTEAVYDVSDRLGREAVPEGFLAQRTLGSYIHLHFGSNPAAAVHFVQTCRSFRHQKAELE